MQQEMERLFNEMTEDSLTSFLALPSSQRKGYNDLDTVEQNRYLSKPIMDLYETDKAVVAEFDLPGVEKNDIDIKIADNNLAVKVEKKIQKEEKNKNFHLLERSYSGFYRCIALPDYVKPEQAKAEYKNGVLTITIPKDEKKIKEKEIKLKVD
ncbi:MAG: Hsp20/alpha crystallin family protein [Candidatus Omnitrophica bacterium]|nr:Hsp20/alpha crystallin family protein [Candidatus Omnitrophota bacterium]